MASAKDLKFKITAVDKTKAAFASINKSLSGIAKSILSAKSAVLGLVGVSGLGLLAKSIVDTNREFQSLKATLETFVGSTEKANKVFGILQDYASTTPFSLKEVTQAFNRMLSVGLNPSIRSLEAFGNVASGSSKTVLQFVEAVADAATGEFERLKEFGIKARTEGDKVSFTFKGVETTVQKTSASITEYLTVLGETSFAGAIERQSKTLNGAFANMGDAFDKFKNQIGEAGLNDALSKTIKNLTVSIGNSEGLAKSIGELMTSGIEALPRIMEGVGRAFAFARDNGKFLLNVLIGIRAVGFSIVILNMAKAAIIFARTMNAAKLATLGFSIANNLAKAGLVVMAIVAASAFDAVDNFMAGVKRLTDLFESKFPNAMEGAKEIMAKLGVNFDALDDSVNTFAPSVVIAGETVEQMDAKLKKLLGTAANTGAVVKAETALSKFGEEAENVFETAQKAGVKSLNSLENALVSFVKTGKLDFKSLADSIISDLIRISIKKSIIGPLAGVMDTAISSMFPARALGGSVSGGRPYMVGEQGPEMFVPGASGTILPNGQGGGGGAVSVNIIDQRSGGQAVGVSEQRNSSGGKTLTVMIRDEMNAAFNGGAMDKTMRSVFGVSRAGASR